MYYNTEKEIKQKSFVQSYSYFRLCGTKGLTQWVYWPSIILSTEKMLLRRALHNRKIPDEAREKILKKQQSSCTHMLLVFSQWPDDMSPRPFKLLFLAPWVSLGNWYRTRTLVASHLVSPLPRKAQDKVLVMAQSLHDTFLVAVMCFLLPSRDSVVGSCCGLLTTTTTNDDVDDWLTEPWLVRDFKSHSLGFPQEKLTGWLNIIHYISSLASRIRLANPPARSTRK